MSKLGTILETMKELSSEEIGTLKKHVDAYVSLCSKGTAIPKSNADIELVLESISVTLCGLGVEFPIPSSMKKASQYREFCASIPGVMEFIRKGAPTKNQQRVLLGIGVRLLYKNITEMGLPTSARTLMSHIHRMPAVINASFPGYAEAGLLGPLLAREEERENG